MRQAESHVFEGVRDATNEKEEEEEEEEEDQDQENEEREEENTEKREEGPGRKRRPCSAVLRLTLILRGLGPTTPWDASSPSAPVGGSASFNISRRPPLVQRFLFVARVPLHGLPPPSQDGPRGRPLSIAS